MRCIFEFGGSKPKRRFPLVIDWNGVVRINHCRNISIFSSISFPFTFFHHSLWLSILQVLRIWFIITTIKQTTRQQSFKRIKTTKQWRGVQRGSFAPRSSIKLKQTKRTIDLNSNSPSEISMTALLWFIALNCTSVRHWLPICPHNLHHNHCFHRLIDRLFRLRFLLLKRSFLVHWETMNK